MSPEQTTSSAGDIDTRSDIYALGVLLYELLTGRTPLDATTLMKASLEEIRRLICEEEPAKPSTALSAMTKDVLGKVSQQRHSDPQKLVHAARGDLDWIAMKALEKDRTRRYGTANGLALDVQRHLRCEAVSAGPPGFTYRSGKFVRKYKGLVAAAAAVLLALLAGLVASMTQYLQKQAAWEYAMGQTTLAEKRLWEFKEIELLLAERLKITSQVSISPESTVSLASAELALKLSSEAGVTSGRNTAIELFQTAADSGSVAAALALGECYLRGKGVVQDAARGIALIRQASNAGHPQAIDMLGICYYRGEGVKRNFTEAFRLFSQAAELGHQQSLGNLAILHLNGEGTERDPLKAVKLMVQGANAGNPHCMCLFARCLQFGIGVRKDQSEAREWYEKAAKAGSEPAQKWLREDVPESYFR
jgi:TPR repeat protein